MIVTSASDVGMVRSDNQDSLFVHEFTDSCGLFIVADGMGGHRGGKMASSLAIEEISRTVIDEFKESMTELEIKDLLRRSIRSANKKIYKASLENEELNGMGTTVVVSVILNNILYTANVGDSRQYIYSDDKFYQVTSDHSLVADLVSRGIISSEEARSHPQKNVITRAVGSEDDVIIDCFVNELKNTDCILMCSDGLNTMLTDEEITSAFANNSDEIASSLIEMANKKGGRDNITVITIKIIDEEN